MKNTFRNTKSYIALVVMSVSVFGIVVWSTVVDFVQQGLSDSKSIRVSEKTTCDESAQSDAKFTGCNSIL